MRVEAYSVKPKYRKWTSLAFSYVLDMAQTNTKTILLLNKKENPQARDTSTFMFSFELSRTLCIQFIETRNANGLSRTIIDKMDMVTGKKRKQSISPISHEQPSSKQTCRVWMNAIIGAEQKKNKDKTAKVKTKCYVCHETFCQKIFALCMSCIPI